MTTERPYTYIHGLPSGSYRAVKLTSSSPYNKWDINFQVKIVSGKLRVAPFEVIVTLFRDKKTGNLYQSIGFKEIPYKERIEIAKEIKEKENGSIWNIDYSE